MILPVLTLVVLAVFGTFPHWWHEEGADYSCSICQASQFRVITDSVRVTVAPPVSTGFDRPPLDASGAADGERIAAFGRSPPA